MKKFYFILLLLASSYSYGQSVISSVNSGAYSNNNMIYSVGEIFVVPVNIDEANSGIIGSLSRIEFLITGFNSKLIADDIRVYPNPTKNSIYFSNLNEENFSNISIYNISGQQVMQVEDFNKAIDLSALPNGTYTIQFNNPNIKSLNIIKQ